ncbi:hypothetical protein VWY03_04955 [Phaeobacter sp. JH20_09]|uniref:hypothetical protein n=1 Tax=unclassified Phaeobacter TaxID=2621772 RepID=UPI003A86A2B6
MTEFTNTMLAAASAATAAAADMIEAAREGGASAIGNIGTGDTCIALADALRLLLDAASGETDEETQLHGAVMRFLDTEPT